MAEPTYNEKIRKAIQELVKKGMPVREIYNEITRRFRYSSPSFIISEINKIVSPPEAPPQPTQEEGTTSGQQVVLSPMETFTIDGLEGYYITDTKICDP